MRILVTGASGFVGSAVADHLAGTGNEIISWVGPGKGSNPDRLMFSVDISDPATFPDQEQFGPVEAVVHCAGIAHRFGRVSNEEFNRINVAGVRNVVEFASGAGAKLFILLSSVIVYGETGSKDPITEDLVPSPADDYGKSKLGGEKTARLFCSSRGIDLVILRPVPIVGEGSKGNVSRLIGAVDRGRFFWIGNGHNKRSFVYVGDVARAVERCLGMNSDLSVFNVVGGTITVKHLVETIAERLNRRIPNIRIPLFVANVVYRGSRVASRITALDRYRRTLSAWLSEAVFSGEALTKTTGFVPETTIEEAIRREVDHFREHR